MALSSRTYIIGVGMTSFVRPLTKKWDYPDMAREAGQLALQDARRQYKDIKAVVASYCYGEPTCGQRAVYELGLTGVPVYNVNNNCSSGSSALMLARRLVMSGVEDCVMAVGFEKMESGLSEKYTDRVSPVSKHMEQMVSLGGDRELINPKVNQFTSDVIKLFAYAAREYENKYPTKLTDTLVDIAFKNRKQGTNNPRASFQNLMSKEAIATKSMLFPPITFGMSSATADGSAAAIVCSEEYMTRNNLQDKAVEILAQNMVTDLPSSFEKSFIELSGFSMAKLAAEKCYAETGLKPDDVDVLEVHDCFSCNELFMYEALGLCPPGQGVNMVKNSEWRSNKDGGELLYLNKKWVVNPSGGLEAKGHPIGATGLAQCAELVWQLRGEAGKRQVEGAKIALQHNYGIGGAAVVTMYGKNRMETTAKL
ncbi:sterol carrier protein 2-like [Physella acuta]|uniref:sterol carrier protein 2-like n=1 Tax=Physella acuta TaxID=109671 RepID=UPI0027DC7035|nr:sterol carrier protein 2-like [Physella acuta]XP_059175920.1 sterol carrier protein 2-like [Physella acuta]